MSLLWTSVSYDYVATVEDTTYRVRRETDYIKPKEKYLSPIEISHYALQARKTKNIEYRNLGYDFYLGEPSISDNDSVDNRLWNDISEILDRCEEILIVHNYIKSLDTEKAEEVNDRSLPSTIYSVAIKTITASLQANDVVPFNLENNIKKTLNEILYWSLHHFRSHPFEKILGEDGEINPICLREYELDLDMCLKERNISLVNEWREVFYDQYELHDDQWLQETLEEERENLQIKAEERLLYSENWTEEKIALLKNKGCGKGEKESYRAWLLPHAVSKKEYFSSIPGSWFFQRSYHLPSHLERLYFYILNWDQDILDIRESFPLERESTIRLCKELKMKHPSDLSTKIPLILTTSFLITRRNGDREETSAISVYRKDKKTKTQNEYISLVEAYWKEKGIKHFSVTEHDINPVLLYNMEWFY